MDKSLRNALLISTIFHVAIFIPLPHIKNSFLKRNLPPIKTTYLAPKEISLRKTRKEHKPRTVVKHEAQKKNVVAKLKVNKSLKPATQHSKIEIPPELPREKEALYLNYYQSIREKIRRIVVGNYPRYITCGEVCLYFVLSSCGELKEINVVEQRSSQNRLLKEIAKRSVQQASPFLPFPKELNQPQLSFNVIVSFELEK